MAARLSLVQQIALVEEAGPVDLDLEGSHARNFDSHEDRPNVNPAAREHYLEVGPSSLRKQFESVSDQKYEGVRTSRKQLMEEEESDRDTGDIDIEDDSGTEKESGQVSSDIGGAVESEDAEPSSDGEEVVESGVLKATKNPPRKRPLEEHVGEDLSAELQKKREEDKKKGKAVSQQITLWESLLDVRIRLQKCTTSANRLPPPVDVKEHLTIPECQNSLNDLLKESTALSEEIFHLTELLLKKNESIAPPPRKRQKLQGENDALIDHTQWLEDATQDASNLEQVYHPHLVHTLARWSSKIQAVAPSALLSSAGNTFSKNSQHTKTVLQLIDEILADHSKILARTQIRRSKGTRIGVPEIDNTTPEEDPNIFDDTDFYQQLLRDIIETKGNGSGGEGDWMATQKRKKAKKKVDTKATKGRKLRYETHEKLQNFMVPVPAIGNWHQEQIDELFSSLLGKGFNYSGPVNGEDDEEARRQEELRLGVAVKGGFRVFG